MPRRMMVSALVVAGLFALVALAQPPGTDEPGQPKAKKSPSAAPGKQAKPADDAVAGALANDPDVQVARAKVLLAEAELAKAKQAVVLKVMTLQATIQEHKSTLAAAEERLAWSARMVEKGQVPQRQMLDERAKVEAAKAALERAETELKLLTGTKREKMGIDGDGATDAALHHGLLWLSYKVADPAWDASQNSNAMMALAALHTAQVSKAPVGAVPDRIRAALDKPVRIGAKGEKVTFEKAMEAFKKEAGLDVPVRGKFPFILRKPWGEDKKLPDLPQSRTIEITSEGEELPVGAWFQLFEDNATSTQPDYSLRRFRFYVRDYGLFITVVEAAPSDAPTLTEFWKQKPHAKGPKEFADPEKKPEK